MIEPAAPTELQIYSTNGFGKHNLMNCYISVYDGTIITVESGTQVKQINKNS